MTPQGRYWCPRCFSRSDFCLAPGFTSSEDLPDLECWTCGYLHTAYTVDQPGGPPKRVHPITRAMRQAAQAEALAASTQRRRANGQSIRRRPPPVPPRADPPPPPPEEPKRWRR